ncbi:MAG TPA: HDOD domain-containing protein [Desulfurivibrio alkaliphilus]|uniref:HDOD domain-containing protein n=1 Tax=Desulfurivibrio alkaliphilus TaxID=427923 RepID=A0A7C2TLV7_9BACT|nr:HDOD domain-containing protein [Desulfurivibrio alkaliphilus]
MNPSSSEIFVARQPIFKRNKEVFAYELLFRSSLANFFDPSQVGGEQATSKVITSSFLLIGLPRLAGGKKVFVNFTEDLLLRGFPTLFPRHEIVVEILEDVRVSRQVLAACEALVRRGYVMALDDFLFGKNLLPLVGLARIIKFDIRQLSREGLARQVATVLRHNPKLKLLAEKIETDGEFEYCKKLGFSLFQGYFFSRPKIVSGRDISGSKLHYLQILRLIQDENYNFEQLATIITRDASLAYKLLKYVNSAYFARAQEISAIKGAVIMLGENNLRQWLSLMMLSYIADDKPTELLRQTIIRGSFCEQIAGLISPQPADSGPFHTAGMFSLLPAMLDKNMADILAEISLAAEVVEALLDRGDGMVTLALRLVIAYEKGEWQMAEEISRMLRIDFAALPPLFARSLDHLEAFDVSA